MTAREPTDSSAPNRMSAYSASDLRRWLTSGPLVTRYNLHLPGASRLHGAASQWRTHAAGERNAEFWLERFAAVSRALRGRDAAVPSFEYPYAPRPRFGHSMAQHPEIGALIARGRDKYVSVLRSFAAHRAALDAIPIDGRDRRSTSEPCWDNGYFEGLDAISLYCLLQLERPRRLLEIGSGYSTKFARASIDASGIATRIVSVDPTPRSDVRHAAHDWITRPFEEAADEVTRQVEPGDFVLLDGSHRAFANSDVTVFFLEVLPRLPAGVLVGIHDIFLPHDYPESWNERYYNEQYVLAAYLLGGARGVEIFLPNYYILADSELASVARDVAGSTRESTLSLGGQLWRGGALFWMRTCR